MATDQRRDRTNEAAAAGASHSAALSLTAGSLILGALLAPTAEHREDAPHGRAMVVPDDDAPQKASSTTAALPANELASASAPSAETHGSDMAVWQAPGAVEPVSAAPDGSAHHPNPLVSLLSELQGDAEFYRAGHGSSAEAAISYDARTSADAGSTATVHAPTNIVDRLASDLGHGLEPLLNSLSDMSSVWQHTTSAIDSKVTELIHSIQGLSAAAVLQDLGDTLHTAADRIVQNLDLPMAQLQSNVLDLTADAQNNSAINIDAVAATGATLLDGLPASLLGGPQANPQADGVLAEAFGTFVPRSEPAIAATIDHTPADSAPIHAASFADFDVGSMLSGDTGHVALGFIGQSYIDAFDAHDVTHHASQSLHGLV